jgi:hypothetical protein
VWALWQQLDRQEEEALSEERAPQTRHGVGVPTEAVLFQAEKPDKPQTEKRGPRYALAALGVPRPGVAAPFSAWLFCQLAHLSSFHAFAGEWCFHRPRLQRAGPGI